MRPLCVGRPPDGRSRARAGGWGRATGDGVDAVEPVGPVEPVVAAGPGRGRVGRAGPGCRVGPLPSVASTPGPTAARSSASCRGTRSRRLAGSPGCRRPCAALCSWPARPRSTGSKPSLPLPGLRRFLAPDAAVADAATTASPAIEPPTEPPTASDPSVAAARGSRRLSRPPRHRCRFSAPDAPPASTAASPPLRRRSRHRSRPMQCGR